MLPTRAGRTRSILVVLQTHKHLLLDLRNEATADEI